MLNRRFVWMTTLALGVTLLAAGCGSNSDPSEDGSIRVVATTTQVADLVREVGGDQVEVAQILQPNTDPHEYEPRPDDVEAVATADLVFRSGGHLDEWADQLIEDSGSGADVIDLSASLPVELHGGEHEHEHEEEGAAEPTAEGDHAAEEGEEVDPHWWHDPTNAVAATEVIQTALSTADPDGEAAIRAGAKESVAQLEAMDESIAECFASIPADQRKMVTDHDAFGYLAGHYDIDVVGTVIPALTTQAEPSAGDLAELEQTIENEDVKAVFSESSVPKKLSDAVAGDTGASTEYELYGDTLGPEDSAGSTYIGMMESNANNLMLGFTGGQQGCEPG